MNKKIIKITIILLVILGMLYFLYSYMFININKQKNFLKSQINILSQEAESLEVENQTLKKDIDMINKEEFFEKEARINLGYKKEDEKAVILKTTTTTKSEEQVKLESSF